MDEKYFSASAYAILLLRGTGLPVATCLRGTGLTEESLRIADYVSSSKLVQILYNIERSDVEPGWSVKAGAQFNTSTHGPLGFAVLSAPTLGAALQALAEFLAVRINSMTAELQQTGKRYRFSMQDLTGDEYFANWIFEVTLKVVESIIESIMGYPAGDDVHISFVQAAPDHADVLEQFYGVPCEFGASHNAISIPSSWQHMPSPLYDEGTYRSNIAKCREILTQQGRSESPAQQVQDVLASHFDRVRAGEIIAPPPGLEHIATSMHMTTRTLIRRLTAGQSSYKQLLQQARCECAEFLLMQAKLTIADVAELLGYQDPANFGRAFRGWKGMTPAAWRRGEH